MKHLPVPLIAFAYFAAFCHLSVGYCDESTPGQSAHFWLDAKLFSLKESDGLDSYRYYTSGGAETSARLTLEASSDTRRFSVDIRPSKKNGRFVANVAVAPHASDGLTRERTREVDVSSLLPQAIDLAEDDDGRVYRLVLVPGVIQRTRPKRFDSSDLRLNDWHFQHSPVILNDHDYLGLLNMGSAEIAWIDIPGLAKIEFSLAPLKGAKPEGILEGGTIRIIHGSDTRLRITNVRNGIDSQTLPGGPYQVWVHWDKPSETIEEYRESMSQRIRDLRERSERGDLALSRSTIERLEKMVHSGRVIQIQSGLREIESETNGAETTVQ